MPTILITELVNVYRHVAYKSKGKSHGIIKSYINAATGSFFHHIYLPAWYMRQANMFHNCTERVNSHVFGARTTAALATPTSPEFLFFCASQNYSKKEKNICHSHKRFQPVYAPLPQLPVLVQHLQKLHNNDLCISNPFESERRKNAYRSKTKQKQNRRLGRTRATGASHHSAQIPTCARWKKRPNIVSVANNINNYFRVFVAENPYR